MPQTNIPHEIPNWINGEQRTSLNKKLFDKINPSSGELLCRVARSGAQDVDLTVLSASTAQPDWAATPPVQRGMILHKIVKKMEQHQREIAEIVAAETGKSPKEAYGEAGGAIALGLFFASEGQRLYGKTTTSGAVNKYSMTIRQPVGVTGLIIAANTPIANIAWKVFPALICGNTAILKAAEDAPATAWFFSKIAHAAGLANGVLNVIQGYGEEAGSPLVAHPEVDLISFTGSTKVGRRIASIAGERLAKVSLELGGKNPLIVCDDADLENAAKWSILSAFSNAGQRCASGSRIIIFDSIYQNFRDLLVEKTQKLSVGPKDEDDLGPVINERQLQNMLAAVQQAKQNGAIILSGGNRLTGPEHLKGFYMSPTIIENVDLHDRISTTELFGPIACLYRTKNFAEAMKLANDSPYGLSSCIHTKNFHRAIEFTQKIESGVAVVNAGTYGSEPHMPFGGLKQSGNGSREPGTEALDVYSELKDIYLNIDPEML